MNDSDALVLDAAPVEPIETVGAIEPRPCDRDPALVYLAGLTTEKGRRAQRGALAAIAALVGATPDTLPWERIEYQHATAIRSRLVARYAPATVNRFLAALRGVLREARRLGLMSAEACVAACDVKRAKGSRLPAGRAISAAERRKLFRAADRDPKAGKRDAALFAIAYACGLRRAEVVGLDLADFSPSDGALTIRGKGNKERFGYVVHARERLDAWLAQRGPAPGPLFWAIDVGGGLHARRLTDDAVLVIFRRLAARAGVAPFSPHDARRTFVGDLLDAGADLSAVQQLAGHSSPVTTQRYDRRGEAAKRKAAGLIRL